MNEGKRRTKQEQHETHVAILEGIAAGDTLLDIRTRLGVTKEALNDDIIRLKRAGCLAGDGRSNSLRVVRMPDAPVPQRPKSAGKRAAAANASIKRRRGGETSRALETSGDGAGDPDVYSILKELADPNGLRMTALFDPPAVAKAFQLRYVRSVDDVALELTNDGRKALGLPVETPPTGKAIAPAKAANGRAAANDAGTDGGGTSRSDDTSRVVLIRLAQRLATELAAALAHLERTAE